MAEPILTRIQPSPDAGRIQLDWSDGPSFEIPYAELRFRCPCAVCVDEHTGRRLIKRAEVRPDVKPRKVEVVGRYAVQIEWSDGHRTGIYAFDTLREICDFSVAPPPVATPPGPPAAEV